MRNFSNYNIDNIKKYPILLDINHPSHFYFFRDFILENLKQENRLCITVKNRSHLFSLFDVYKIPYIIKGKRAKHLTGKMTGLIKEVFQLYFLILHWKPKMILSFASPYASIAGWLAGKPVISFDDTEFDPLLHLIFPRFSSLIITPNCFQESFGKKHIKFNGYKESVYLSKTINEKTNHGLSTFLKNNKPYILVRFVNHHSTHEVGQNGLTNEDKHHLVNKLGEQYNVVISSEGPLPDDLKDYELNTPIEKIHQVLKNAILYFGESTTMAAESAVLGTPAVLIENKKRGYIEDLQYKLKTIKTFKTNQVQQALDTAINWLNYPGSETGKKVRQIMGETTNITGLLWWLSQEPLERTTYLKEHPEFIKKFDNPPNGK